MSEKYETYMNIPYADENMERVRILARTYIKKAVLEERRNLIEKIEKLFYMIKDGKHDMCELDNVRKLLIKEGLLKKEDSYYEE
jgi:hypothetical protein